VMIRIMPFPIARFPPEPRYKPALKRRRLTGALVSPLPVQERARQNGFHMWECIA
jgi:hypothetical protein